MTTYRLPDALGGGECELVQWKTDGYPSFASVQIEGIVLIVPHEYLAAVAIEPESGYYVLDDGSDPGFLAVAEHEEGYGWLVAGHEKSFTWAELCAEWPSLTFTRLVPPGGGAS